MIDNELKKEIDEKVVELLKGMTPEERGEFTANILQISLHLTMMENLPESMKQALKKNEKKVS